MTKEEIELLSPGDLYTDTEFYGAYMLPTIKQVVKIIGDTVYYKIYNRSVVEQDSIYKLEVNNNCTLLFCARLELKKYRKAIEKLDSLEYDTEKDYIDKLLNIL